MSGLIVSHLTFINVWFIDEDNNDVVIIAINWFRYYSFQLEQAFLDSGLSDFPNEISFGFFFWHLIQILWQCFISCFFLSFWKSFYSYVLTVGGTTCQWKKGECSKGIRPWPPNYPLGSQLIQSSHSIYLNYLI